VSIQTPEQWWNIFTDELVHIEAIFEKVGVNINEPQVETFGIYHIPTIAQILEQCAAQRGDTWMTAVEWLQKLWEAAPDAPVIHTWEGWHSLCDLCSEKWVFEENDYEADSNQGGA